MPINYNHNNIITLGKQIKNTAKSQWAFDKVNFLLSKANKRNPKRGKKNPTSIYRQKTPPKEKSLQSV